MKEARLCYKCNEIIQYHLFCCKEVPRFLGLFGMPRNSRVSLTTKLNAFLYGSEDREDGCL
mgnify:CR=1 FL=1